MENKEHPEKKMIQGVSTYLFLLTFILLTLINFAIRQNTRALQDLTKMLHSVRISSR
jgi:hypothetical protein